jgi:aspartate/methionine/tyrosine aminotransferase
MQERTVILYTCSKRFAMTGWRIGAAIGPENLIATINRMNTNTESCTAQFIQYAALEAIIGNDGGPTDILKALRERRDATATGLNAINGISISAPDSTFYLYPNVTDIMARKGLSDVDELMMQALHQSNVSFCTSNHFGRPINGVKNHYIRFAYSGIDVAEINEGMKKLKVYFEAS